MHLEFYSCKEGRRDVHLRHIGRDTAESRFGRLAAIHSDAAGDRAAREAHGQHIQQRALARPCSNATLSAGHT